MSDQDLRELERRGQDGDLVALRRFADARKRAGQEMLPDRRRITPYERQVKMVQWLGAMVRTVREKAILGICRDIKDTGDIEIVFRATSGGFTPDRATVTVYPWMVELIPGQEDLGGMLLQGGDPMVARLGPPEEGRTLRRYGFTHEVTITSRWASLEDYNARSAAFISGEMQRLGGAWEVVHVAIDESFPLEGGPQPHFIARHTLRSVAPLSNDMTRGQSAFQDTLNLLHAVDDANEAALRAARISWHDDALSPFWRAP
jgi:hypothetical protein